CDRLRTRRRSIRHVEYSVAVKTTTWYALRMTYSAATRVITMSNRRGLDKPKTVSSATYRYQPSTAASRPVATKSREGSHGAGTLLGVITRKAIASVGKSAHSQINANAKKCVANVSEFLKGSRRLSSSARSTSANAGTITIT